MRRRLLAVVALALGACQQPAPPPSEEPRDTSLPAPAPTAAPASAPPAAASPETERPARETITDLAALAGEYRVAGAGGRGIDLPHAITARIDDTGMIVTSDCLILSWVWFFEGDRLVTEQLTPRASCGRALLPAEQAIAAAVNGATGLTRTPANGIEIAGENGAVLLFSQ